MNLKNIIRFTLGVAALTILSTTFHTSATAAEPLSGVGPSTRIILGEITCRPDGLAIAVSLTNSLPDTVADIDFMVDDQLATDSDLAYQESRVLSVFFSKRTSISESYGAATVYYYIGDDMDQVSFDVMLPATDCVMATTTVPETIPTTSTTLPETTTTVVPETTTTTTTVVPVVLIPEATTSVVPPVTTTIAVELASGMSESREVPGEDVLALTGSNTTPFLLIALGLGTLGLGLLTLRVKQRG